MRSYYEASGRLCHACGERFAVPDELYCSGCAIFAEEEIDQRDCPACGSALGFDGSCLCDLGPAGDTTYWKDRRL